MFEWNAAGAARGMENASGGQLVSVPAAAAAMDALAAYDMGQPRSGEDEKEEA